MTRTSAARALLRGYALAWIERSLKGSVLRAASVDDPVEALFVDPFAGADHPLPPGSTPLAVQVLARLFAPAGAAPARARAVLLEEDPVKLEWLREACREAGLEARTRGDPPEIALVEGRWEGGAPGWEGEEARTALALLDPPRAGEIPLERILSLLRAQPQADLLLRFPASDLRRLSGFRGVPLADLPPYARRAAEGISRLLGDERHAWALRWRAAQAERGDAAGEAEVVDALAGRLRGATGRLVRVFRVESADGAEALLLVSGDPARVLLMNEVLHDARAAGWLPWAAEEEDGLVRTVARGELELFGGVGEGRDRVVDLSALAHALAGRFAGRRVELGTVLESVLESDLFLDDVRRALAALRRDGRALYRSLRRPDAEVAFIRSGGEQLPRRGARGRRRGGEEGELLLPFDPDGE